MLTDVKMHYDKSSGQVKMRTTYDISEALNAIREANELNPTSRFGDSNNKSMLLGYIPEEMFAYDPWLVEANKARLHGDKALYQQYITKFFEINPIFKTHRNTVVWGGHRAVLL